MGGQTMREADAVALAKWSAEEAKITQREKRNILRSQLEEEINPRRSLLHNFFIFASILTMLAAILMAIGQFIGLYYSHVGLLQFVLRIYVMALCLLVVLNELELTSMTRESAMLRIWLSRGIIYAFIGILGLEEIEASPATKNEDTAGRDQALTFIQVIAWIMIALGLMYSCFGALCLQLVYNRHREDYQHRVERSSETRRATQTYAGVDSDDVV